MNAVARQSLAALGFFAVVALLIGGAATGALALRDEQASLDSLKDQAQALEARARRIAPHKGGEAEASPFIDADTITLAGAVLQQRVESAVAAAAGRLVSSKVEVGGRSDAKRVALEAELTILQPDMQRLLFDLETGRPYLFVEAFEARAPEKTDAETAAEMRVSLTLSGQWGGVK